MKELPGQQLFQFARDTYADETDECDQAAASRSRANESGMRESEMAEVDP